MANFHTWNDGVYCGRTFYKFCCFCGLLFAARCDSNKVCHRRRGNKTCKYKLQIKRYKAWVSSNLEYNRATTSAWQKKRYRADPERYRQQIRAYRSKNRAQVLANQRRYRSELSPEEKKRREATDRRWRANNLERLRENRKKWRANNLERLRERELTYAVNRMAARRLAAEFGIPCSEKSLLQLMVVFKSEGLM